MLRTVIGALQQYDWGDTEALPRLLHMVPDGKPWAEMWFGTHHMAPSHIDSVDGPLLVDVTGEMTILMKLLSCAQPLSLQTHPTLEQAIDGFNKEESLGIDRTAFTRMYRDASDKPEMLIALEPFEALCGFRNINESIALLQAMGWKTEASILDDSGLDGYLLWAFEQTGQPLLAHSPEWLQRIATIHPDDPGIRIAPLLHHVVLQPGEAIALPAGNLHAYLHGTGLEVMKSSDNVVRAGFTGKHINVAELLRLVDMSELAQPVVQPEHVHGITLYPSPSDAFTVQSIDSAQHTSIAAVNKQRLIFGHFETVPSVKLLVANEAAELPANSGVFWVCTQN